MTHMKYVMHGKQIGEKIPILFDARFEHRKFGHAESAWSAGFVEVTVVEGKLNVSTFGYSESTGLKAEPTDAEIIKRKLDPMSAL